jgi:hypothetical protein
MAWCTRRAKNVSPQIPEAVLSTHVLGDRGSELRGAGVVLGLATRRLVPDRHHQKGYQQPQNQKRRGKNEDQNQRLHGNVIISDVVTVRKDGL